MFQKIGILCAGDEELAPFLPLLKNHSVCRQTMLTIHEGLISGVPVAVLYSGVCKVNAAIAAQVLIDRFQADAIINAGTAGGIDPVVSIFDTVVSTEAAYHDVSGEILTDFHPWLDSIWFPGDPSLLSLARQASRDIGYPVHFGRIVTGEAFLSGPGTEAVWAVFHPLCADMESAAIAHVCHVNGIPFLSIRTITDSADHSAAACFEQNCRRASEIAAQVTRALLKYLAAGGPYPPSKNGPTHDSKRSCPPCRISAPAKTPPAAATRPTTARGATCASRRSCGRERSPAAFSTW